MNCFRDWPPPRILQMELPDIENTTDVVEGGADNVESGSSDFQHNQ
jgi:hypothetical protein